MLIKKISIQQQQLDNIETLNNLEFCLFSIDICFCIESFFLAAGYEM